MRLRNVKGSREHIAINEYVIKDAENYKGTWKEVFQDGWNGRMFVFPKDF